MDPRNPSDGDGNESSGCCYQASSGDSNRTAGGFSHGVVENTSEKSVMDSEKSDVNCQIGGCGNQPPPEMSESLLWILLKSQI